MHAILTPIVFALASLVPLASAGAPAWTEDALARVLHRGRFASKADVEEVGQRADEAAFQALRKVAREARGSSMLNAAFRALRHFRGTELEQPVIAFIARQASDRHGPRRAAAARGLLSYEEEAQEELERIVEDSSDPLCRAIALRGIVSQLEREGSAEALKTILENTILGVTLERPRVVELLDTFRGEDALALFERSLRDADVSPFVQSAIVDSLAGRTAVLADASSGTGALETALRSRHPMVAYAAMRWLLDPEGLDPALFRSEISRLERSDDASVRRAAAILAGRIRQREETPSVQLKRLRVLARSRHAADRQAAAVLAGEHGSPEAAEIVHELLKDPDRSVASEALLATGALRRKETVPLLIELLAEARGQPRLDLREALSELTGIRLSSDARAWRAWWAERRDAFEVPPLADVRRSEKERAERQEAHASRATFYGLPVVSERLAFVLDVSGSMGIEAEQGVTRLDAAARELADILERLPDGILINVLFFSDEVQAWRDELVELDQQARESLLAFVRRQEADGSTNVYDALETAMLDRRIDTIYLLADGRPEVGATIDPDQIRHEVERWNSTGHVVLHAVSLGGESPLLRELARHTGGRYRTVAEGD